MLVNERNLITPTFIYKQVAKSEPISKNESGPRWVGPQSVYPHSLNARVLPIRGFTREGFNTNLDFFVSEKIIPHFFYVNKVPVDSTQ